MEQIKQSAKACYHSKGLNKDGSEIIDDTKLSVPLARYKSAEMKLKEMLQRELAKANEQDETLIDSVDFNLPDDSIPLHPLVESNPVTIEQVKKVINEPKQQPEPEQTDDETPVVRKSASTDRPKVVAKRKSTNTKAAEELPTEGAGEE